MLAGRRALKLGVVEIVGHVRQDRPPWLQPICPAQRVGDA